MSGDGEQGYVHISDVHSLGGMTLRDYFAAKELSKVNGVDICDIPEAYVRLANHCYRMTDAMIAERENKL